MVFVFTPKIFGAKIQFLRMERTSVTRRQDYLFNFWPFTTMKICPIVQKIAKVGLKYFQTPNKPLETCPRLLKFTQVAKFRQIWSRWNERTNRERASLRNEKGGEKIQQLNSFEGKFKIRLIF